MRRSVWKAMAACLLCGVLLTGCWDRKDPEDRAFLITIGADAAEEGFRFTFAPANTGEGEAEAYAVEADTLADALAQADCRSSRKTDLGQMKTVILGRSVLEREELLSALLRELEWNHAVSKKAMLLATEDTAAECVEAAMEEDGETGLFLWDFYKNTAGEVAVTKGLDLDTFLTERREQAGAGILPKITAEYGKLRLGGGISLTPDGLFSLNHAQERGYLFLLGEAEGALLEGEYEGETLPLRVVKSSASYDFAETPDGIRCTVTLPFKAALEGGDDVFLSGESLEAVENLFEGIIKQEIENTIAIAKREGRCDIFGILPRLSRQNPSLAAGREREALWESMIFEIRPEWKR